MLSVGWGDLGVKYFSLSGLNPQKPLQLNPKSSRLTQLNPENPKSESLNPETPISLN